MVGHCKKLYSDTSTAPRPINLIIRDHPWPSNIDLHMFWNRNVWQYWSWRIQIIVELPIYNLLQNGNHTEHVQQVVLQLDLLDLLLHGRTLESCYSFFLQVQKVRTKKDQLWKIYCKRAMWWLRQINPYVERSTIDTIPRQIYVLHYRKCEYMYM
jgi:hypothetical protein